jgi:hypothetical protein
MEKLKRNMEFIANNTSEALELKKSLEKEGFNVNHIYTGSSVPILIDKGNYTVGAGNIRTMYKLF